MVKISSKHVPQQRSRLPLPPSSDTPSEVLEAPETAPTWVDGRSARATGRTKPFSTRLREDFHDDLRLYAAKHRLKLVEVLELAFAELKKKEKM